MDIFTLDRCSLIEERTNGEIDRRGLLRLAGVLGLATPALLAATAARAATEVVLVNWGGDAVTAAKKAWGEPFEKASGLKMAVDSTGPSAGKIKAMVESKRVTWDVMDTTFGDAGELGPRGMLEPIDYTVVDKGKVLEGFAQPFAVAGYGYSNILAYDSAKFADRKPQSWADFWNLKDFPGKRMLGRPLGGNLEAALQADGVPRDKLYPLDVPRALKKIGEIKKDCIFWTSGAQSQQLLRDGEVSMGQLWSTRAFLLHRDTKGRIVTVWNQGMFQTNAWTVPKGNPAGKDAMRLIASMQAPQGQVEMLQLIGFGPVNPAAAALVPAELRAQNPSDPQNLAGQVKADVNWYAENQAKVVQQYLDLIAS
jgi:putative spermidine/putrescine transport system substrate-binding protein